MDDATTSANKPASSSCRHRRTQLIAKDDAAEYVECLECGAILEAAERDLAAEAAPAPASAGDSDQPPRPDFPESLSDA